MTTKIHRIAIVLLLNTLNTFAQTEKAKNVHIGLVHPLSTNGTDAANISNNYSFHALTGLSANENRLSMYGIAGVVKNNVSGTQLSGIANIVGNNVNGIQITGFANLTKYKSKGLQLAGFSNMSGSLDGTQIAGFSNLVRENSRGLQISGFLNQAGDINHQVAGFINIAKRVKGVQVGGFINIAESSDYPVGIINIIKNGEKLIGINTDETLTSMVSFRSGGRILYGIIGAGYNFKTSENIAAAEAGIGVHIPITSNFRTNIELASIFHYNFDKGEFNKGVLRILPAYTIGRCEIFAGPTLNHFFYEDGKGSNLVKRYLWSNRNGDRFNGMYIGVMGGIHFKI